MKTLRVKGDLTFQHSHSTSQEEAKIFSACGLLNFSQLCNEDSSVMGLGHCLLC
jgi:hypothetical protein